MSLSPEVMGDTPVFAGTRVPVQTLSTKFATVRYGGNC
ncbi:DUF433 domain-containing protein [Tolypothrix sp. FACHB-123]|nr:DUF433 domain-containing protein [Tolypothrix sp. FACHB-123]